MPPQLFETDTPQTDTGSSVTPSTASDREQPTLALAEEGSAIPESEPSGGSAASPGHCLQPSSSSLGQQLLGDAEAPQWGPCPESRDSFRNLTAFLCFLVLGL